jgi:1,2-diacylglycerol 3-beta-glucosyltransferase
MALVLGIFLFHNVVVAAFAWWWPRPRRPGPGDGLTFWIVILGTDEKAITAAHDLAEPGYPVRVLCQDTTHTVGESLNAAYRHIRDCAVQQGTVRQTVIGVIHGDGYLEPGALGKVAAFFSGRRVGAVQCRVRMRNRLRDLDFTAAEDASQRLRDAFGQVRLGGNGQFVRLTSLMRLGDRPWAGSIGLRLHLAGVGIRYAPDAVVTQQAAPRFDLRSLRYLHELTGLSAIALVAPWLGGPLAAAVAVLSVGSGNVVWLAALLLPGLVHRLRPTGEPWRRTIAAGLLYPVFVLFRMAAPWHALFRLTNVVPMAPARLLPWADGHPGLSTRRP